MVTPALAAILTTAQYLDWYNFNGTDHINSLVDFSELKMIDIALRLVYDKEKYACIPAKQRLADARSWRPPGGYASILLIPRQSTLDICHHVRNDQRCRAQTGNGQGQKRSESLMKWSYQRIGKRCGNQPVHPENAGPQVVDLRDARGHQAFRGGSSSVDGQASSSRI